MNTLKRMLLGSILFMALSYCAVAQESLKPIVFEAELGQLGSDYKVLEDADITYITANENFTGQSGPEDPKRIVNYEITFQETGSFQLYARIRVGSGGFNDDSFFAGNGFGTKSETTSSDWIMINGLGGAGFANSIEVVKEIGVAGSEVWKWVNISQNFFAGDLTNSAFTVEGENLTQNFQIGTREDGLEFDKFAFGRSDLYFTVEMLDNELEGSLTVPEPDSSNFYKGPPLADGSPKFLGNVKPKDDSNFANLWNQVTPGNDGKWGSIAASADSSTWNWSDLDDLYSYAKQHNLIFKDHTLIWGAQQPAWINNLTPEEQLVHIESWIRQVGTRYPDIEMVDVVNEALPNHNPPDGIGTRANYKEALGGDGASGWDWVIKSFELARKYMPNTKLILNDYGIINSNSATTSYLEIINLLNDRELIDGIGVQGHRFALETAATSTLKNNLDRLGATGLPIYMSEVDLGNIKNEGIPDDAKQLELYQKIFPILWEHPSVHGITLWGYIENHMWQPSCYLVLSDGTWRPAMEWLAQYIKDTPVNNTSTIPDEAYQQVKTFVNPIMPGDHPDLTLFKDGNDFYACGSNFHFTPYLPLLHSTDLVHWEEICRVVPSNWSGLVSDAPQAGTWAGVITYFYDSYWMYFSNTAGGGQYFCKADNPAGPWTSPVKVQTTSTTGPIGYDNSVFVDDDGTPYMMIKPGQVVNRIQEIGQDGHLLGDALNLDWVNADKKYSWAEGPVMCKRNGWYYYFIAGNVYGGQYVLRSQTLTDDPNSWETMGDFFENVSDPAATFRSPNHISQPFMLDDGTWWTIAHSYEKVGSNDWNGQGRQGLLFQVNWGNNGKPTGVAPTSTPKIKP
nr:endo-1,4-beta-xylanase [Prolixibacteraceae bacterium]